MWDFELWGRLQSDSRTFHFNEAPEVPWNDFHFSVAPLPSTWGQVQSRTLSIDPWWRKRRFGCCTKWWNMNQREKRGADLSFVSLSHFCSGGLEACVSRRAANRQRGERQWREWAARCLIGPSAAWGRSRSPWLVTTTTSLAKPELNINGNKAGFYPGGWRRSCKMMSCDVRWE